MASPKPMIYRILYENTDPTCYNSYMLQCVLNHDQTIRIDKDSFHACRVTTNTNTRHDDKPGNPPGVGRLGTLGNVRANCSSRGDWCAAADTARWLTNVIA